MKKFIWFFLLLFSVVFYNVRDVYALDAIEIKDISVVEKGGSVVVDDLVYENNSVTSRIEFSEVNDFVTLNIDVKNNTNISYVLDSIINNLQNDYISVESDQIGSAISTDDITSLRVKIIYKKELQNDDMYLSDGSFSLSFKDPTTLVNPITGNKTVVLFLAALLLFALAIFMTKRKRKTLLLLLLLLIPVGVFAINSINLKINISFKDVTIKGRYLDYDIVIYNEDGQPETIVKKYGTPLSELTPPSKTGYTFVNWVDENNNVITSETVVSGPMTITPQFSVIEYSINYDLAGGTVSQDNPTTYTVEDEITLHNPSKVGYTFAGWSSDGETYQTSYTIAKGTTGDLNISASFSANQNTLYTVIHRKMNLEGEYVEEEREELHGATDTNVTPQTKNYTGFTAPEVQTKKIEGDGSTSFTYDYTRNQYTFSISDRTYITQNSTQDGTYYYGMQIIVTAQERAGYSFRWSDNTTSLTKEFTLSADTALTPVYTANTNTQYKVLHKQMNMDGETYTLKDEETFYGTTDAEVEPNTNVYEGFTTPAKQRVTINGNGTTQVEYLYTRNQYTLTIEDSQYVETETPSGDYYYGTSITLTAKNKAYHTFVKWSNENTANPTTFTLRDDTTIGPVYNHNGYVITFDANGGNVTEESRVVANNSEIGELPTGIKALHYLDGWWTDLTGGTKVDSTYMPTANETLYARWKKSIENATFESDSLEIEMGSTDTITITNPIDVEEEYTYLSSDEEVATVDENGEVTGVSEGETTIVITGVKSGKTVTVDVNVLSTDYTITFDANGEEVEFESKVITSGQAIGSLPSVYTEEEYKYFDGWYTANSGGVKVTSSYVPLSSMTLYARWKRSVDYGIRENDTMTIVVGGEKAIFDNMDEIENCEYSVYEQNIATVNDKGIVKANNVGTTTVYVYGEESYNSRYITVNVVSDFTVLYNGNGGTINSDQTNEVTYSLVQKYSYTGNLQSDGYRNNGYKNGFNNSNIAGSGREDFPYDTSTTRATEELDLDYPAHVVTIDGATSLKVDIYYNSSDVEHDWATIWEGAHEDYSATNNYESAIDGAEKLGGPQDGEYTLGEYVYYNLDHKSFVVSGDSVTFGFIATSGGIDYSDYGYYAVISAMVATNGEYADPVKENSQFIGWYKDQACSDDQLFDLTQATGDVHLYAGYGSVITYDVNGGSKLANTKQNVIEGREIGTLPAPTRIGYVLDGWWTDLTGGTKIASNYVPDGNVTLYARWRKSVESAIIDPSVINLGLDGSEAITITNANQIGENYTFVSNNKNVVTVTKEGVVTAIAEGSTTIELVGKESNARVVIPVTVKYLRNYITFDSNGGSHVNDMGVVDTQSYGTLPTPVREGYNFLGWYTGLLDGVKVEESDVPSGNVMLYARWNEASTYTITFDVDGGELAETTKEVYGGNAIGTLPTPTKENYYFNGWYDPTNNEYYNSSSIINDDITLKASWGVSSKVARINSTYYSSINGAIENANSNDEIVLLKDTTENVTNNKNIVLNLNSNKLTGTINNNQNGNLVIKNGIIEKNGSTVINNSGTLALGTLDSSDNEAVNLYSNRYIVSNSGDVIVNNANLYVNTTSSYEAINSSSGNITMNRGNILVTSSSGIEAIYGTANVVVNGGVISAESTDYSSAYGISISGNVVINDGVIIAKSNSSSAYGIAMNHTNSSLIVNKGTISATSNGNSDAYGIYDYYGADVTINGGTILGISNGDSGYGIYLVNRHITINDGTISGISKNDNSYGVYMYTGDIVMNNGIVSSLTFNPDYNVYGISGKTKFNGGLIITHAAEEDYRINMDDYEIPYGKTLIEEEQEDDYEYAYLDNARDYKTITFDGIDGSAIGSSKVLLQTGDRLGFVPSGSKNGYYLDGWYTEPTGGLKINESTIVTDDVTYYAHWKKSIASANLEKSSVTLDKNEEYTVNITNLDTIEEDFTYSSNNTSVATVDANGVITGLTDGIVTITLKGVKSYQTKTISVTVISTKYLVTLDANNGADDSDRGVVVEAGSTIGDVLIPTKSDNSKFAGWYTLPDGGIKIENDYVPSGNVTLYARWTTPESYEITYDANGGTLDEVGQIVYSDLPIGTMPKPTNSGLYFMGWKDETADVFYSSSTKPTKNVTLKAQWSETSYAARINSNYYSSISSAISAASSGDEIVILKNSTTNITTNKNIILNLNGYKMSSCSITNQAQGVLNIIDGTITNSSSSTLITNSGTLTIGDASVASKNGVTVTKNYSGTIISNSGSLIVNDLTLTSTGTYSATRGINNSSSASVTMNGGSITISGDDDMCGIAGSGIVSINGGTISVSSSDYNSYSAIGVTGNKIIVAGGFIEAKSTDRASVYSLYSTGNVIEMYGGLVSATTNTNKSADAYGGYGKLYFAGGIVKVKTQYPPSGRLARSYIIPDDKQLVTTTDGYLQTFTLQDK